MWRANTYLYILQTKWQILPHSARHSRDGGLGGKSTMTGGGEHSRVDVANTTDQLLDFTSVVTIDGDLGHFAVESHGLEIEITYIREVRR